MKPTFTFRPYQAGDEHAIQSSFFLLYDGRFRFVLD
jgi:hypothetical protein